MAADEDIANFERFARERQPALVRFAVALVRDPLEAEDLVQSALAKTWAAWPRVRRRDAPDAYVRRVIANEHIARWRHRTRDALPRQRDRVEVVDPPPDRDELLWDALQSLPPRQRAVVVLRYCEDRSEAATAEIMGCSTGTVKSQSAKGLATLRTRLDAARAEEAQHD